MAYFFRTYRVATNGERIDGMPTFAFIFSGGTYYLTAIVIFQDGMIGGWELVDFEEFKRNVRSGRVVTQPPPRAKIMVSSVGSFTAIDPFYRIEPEEFIKEVADTIEALNGRPTTSNRCQEAWAAHEHAPSEATKEALRMAYEAIPKHKRIYVLGDMTDKDSAIRAVLYPDEHDILTPAIPAGTGAMSWHATSPKRNAEEETPTRLDWMRESLCTRVWERNPGSVMLEFGETEHLEVASQWRVIVAGRVALASRDHGRRTKGFPPVDVYTELTRLLGGKRIVRAQVTDNLADLLIEFENGVQLEIHTDSAAYEAWELAGPSETLYGIGGGGVLKFPRHR